VELPAGTDRRLARIRERRRLGLRGEQLRWWLVMLAMSGVGLVLLAIGEPRETQKGLAIEWVLFAGLVYGIAFLLDRYEGRLGAWADAKLAPFGLGGLLLLAGGWFLFLGVAERQTHEGLGLAAVFGAVGVAVFGAAFLKHYERLVAGDEDRKALRTDLYQAYLLCHHPDAASTWDRVQLAARIASRAVASPLLARGGDDVGHQLAERIAGGSVEVEELRICIRLLEGPGDHNWLFDRRWLYYVERPRPKSVTRQLASLRALACSDDSGLTQRDASQPPEPGVRGAATHRSA
jgi:hypothetical protein